MSAEKRKPALATPVLKNEKAEAGNSTLSAPVTLLAMAALYRRAGVRARSDSPSIAELEAEGYAVVHVDQRYGTALMRKADDDLDEDRLSDLIFGPRGAP